MDASRVAGLGWHPVDHCENRTMETPAIKTPPRRDVGQAATPPTSTLSRESAPAAAPTRAVQGEPPDDHELHHMIQEAAYYRAEHRGFASGHEFEDWIEAEKELRQQVFGEGRILDA